MRRYLRLFCRMLGALLAAARVNGKWKCEFCHLIFIIQYCCMQIVFFYTYESWLNPWWRAYPPDPDLIPFEPGASLEDRTSCPTPDKPSLTLTPKHSTLPWTVLFPFFSLFYPLTHGPSIFPFLHFCGHCLFLFSELCFSLFILLFMVFYYFGEIIIRYAIPPIREMSI